MNKNHIDDLVQDYGNSSALAMELPQSCMKPSIYQYTFEYQSRYIKLGSTGIMHIDDFVHGRGIPVC